MNIQDAIDKLLREQSDQANMIETLWRLFAAHVEIPTGGTQWIESRRCFFAGAATLFEAFIRIMEHGSDPTDADLARVDAIAKERPGPGRPARPRRRGRDADGGLAGLASLHRPPWAQGRGVAGAGLPTGRGRPLTHRFELPPPEWAEVKRKAITRDGYRCANPLCRRPGMLDPDHVVPRSAGGPDTLENCITLCRVCHDLKHAGILLVIPNGDGTNRFWDLRRVLTCESCARQIAAGERVAVPTPNGGLRWIPAPVSSK